MDILGAITNLANALNKGVNATRTLESNPTDMQMTAASVSVIGVFANLASAWINTIKSTPAIRKFVQVGGGIVNVLNAEVQKAALDDALASGDTEQIIQASLDFGSSVAGVLGAFPTPIAPKARAIQIALAGASSLYKNRQDISTALDTLSVQVRTYRLSSEKQISGVNRIISDVKPLFDKAEITRSPIILDLNGDGVRTLSLSEAINFDQDGNGFAEQTGWVSKDDGLLVWDRNGNGQIDNGGELFGNSSLLANGNQASNGFAALAEFDSNHDGNVNATDVAFAQLLRDKKRQKGSETNSF